MNNEELQTLAQRAAQELKIDAPIYKVQAVGHLLHITLPDRVVLWSIPGRVPKLTMTEKDVLRRAEYHSRAELHCMTDRLGITPDPRQRGRRPWKKDLVEAINRWKDETQWTP